MARQVEITQNSKFAISLHFKKKVSDEVDFLQANKHESLLQLDAMILMELPSIPKVSKTARFQCLYYMSNKRTVLYEVLQLQVITNSFRIP